MLQRLHHRGPDGTGEFLEETEALGAVRLACLDLDTGNQPLHDESKTVWVVCNGEIFNYRSLRDDLEKHGYLFHTKGDIEILVHLYKHYGPEGFSLLNGQFAFALWDSQNRKLFLCRDRFGICPLFFCHVGHSLYFASEVKALLCVPEITTELDLPMLGATWTMWAPLPGRTLFKNVREIMPSHYGEYVPAIDRLTFSRYWNMSFANTSTVNEAKERYGALLDHSVYLRSQADVRIGAYLSGGVDSAVVAAMATRHCPDLQTLSISFTDSAYDESEEQFRVAQFLGTTHHMLRCSSSDIVRSLARTIFHTECPQLRAGPVPMLLLSELAHSKNLKVVLTGEGADEFLLGYDIFKEVYIRRFIARHPDSGCRKRLLDHLYQTGPARIDRRGLDAFLQQELGSPASPLFSHFPRWRTTQRLHGYFRPEIRKTFDLTALLDNLTKCLPPDFSDLRWMARAQVIESITFLSQVLLSSQGDRVAMANGVETRPPFLDHRLVELSNSFSVSLKLRSLKQDKYILREVARAYLPVETAERTKRA
jgi:asparagine synthase (glutamine-hydrolysing)